jgi:predicted transposase YbfD/YdcC
MISENEHLESNPERLDNCQIQKQQQLNESIMLFFQDVPDPRASDNCRYSLCELLFIMLMAVFSGANCVAGIHDYACERKRQLAVILGEDFIPPSYDTFWWILTRMDHQAFAKAFFSWVKSVHVPDLIGEQVCIDGKTLRGAINRSGKQNIHIVHAWVHDRGVLIRQKKTEEKSNEIAAIPELLEQLDLYEAIITIDAAGCQKEIAKKIRVGGGNYILGLKKNQKNFYHEVTNLFSHAENDGFEYVLNCDFHETIEKNRGRIEKRRIAVIGDPSEISTVEEWAGLNSLIEVTREITRSNKTTIEKSYYISSLIESAEEFGRRILGHWQVESMHWSLDMIFDEDECRVNVLNAALNLATLKRIVQSIVKGNPLLKKQGMARTRRRAQWNEDGSVFREICEALFGVKSF